MPYAKHHKKEKEKEIHKKNYVKKGFNPKSIGRPFQKGHKLQVGDKHSNWKGGIQYKPYPVDWTETLKRAIRERDRYTCQLCGKQQGDITHDVHHIDYDKTNCNPDNLITLCKCCHVKTNYNRKKWRLKLIKYTMEVRVNDTRYV